MDLSTMMGEPIFSLRMWLGIPVSSRDLRNSTGYCNCTVHRFVLLFLARELVHEPGIELVDISVGWRDDRSLSQPLWLGTVCIQVLINLGFEFFQVGHTRFQLCWDVDGLRLCREWNPAIADSPEKVGKISSSFVAAQVSPHVGIEFHYPDLAPQVRHIEAGIDDISPCSIFDNRQNLPEVTAEKGWNDAHEFL